MLVKPTPKDVDLGPDFCGSKKLMFGQTGAYYVKRFCKLWDCPDCRKMKTRRIIRRLRRFFKEKKFSTIFMAVIVKTSKAMSRWLDKNIEGWFFRVSKVGGGYLSISNKGFDDAIRIGTGKALELIETELMKEGVFNGKRYSYSRELGKYLGERKTETHNLAYISDKVGKEIPKALEKEFNSLKTNAVKADFLKRKALEGVIKITKEGKEFIRIHGVTENGITVIDEESNLVFINFEKNTNINKGENYET